MKSLKENKEKKIMVGVLVLFVLFLAAAPHQLEAKICEKALGRCLADAVVVAIFGGINSGLAYAAGCGIGYHWCLDYID